VNVFKATNESMVVGNFVGLSSAGLAVCLGYFSPLYFVAALVVWQFMSIFGIAMGVHRYFSHNAFKANKFWQWVMAITSMAALNGPPCMWAEAHGRHHAYSDTDKDPYTRFLFGNGSAVKHTTQIEYRTLARIIRKSDLHRVALKYHWLFVAGAAALMTLIGVASGMNPAAALFWLWLAPAGMTQASLRFILWTGHTEHGYKNFDTKDLARNWWFTSLFCAGEGWHNNHHHAPRNPSCQVKWWEFDISYFFIRLIRSN